MAKAKLTDRYVDSIAPPDTGRLEVSDKARAGLRLRVSASGAKTWFYEKRIKGGPKRKYKLGPYPLVGVAEARAKCAELELEALQGIDRVALAERGRKEQERAALSVKTVESILDLYVSLHVKNLRTSKERERSLRASLSKLMAKPIGDLSRADLQGVIDAKAASGALVQANRVRAELGAFANFAWQRGHLTDKIGAQLSKVVKEKPRDRILTIGEVQQIWQASYHLGDMWGPLVRLLVLTAQRRSNIAKLRWDEVDLVNCRVSMASSREKNAQPHITHLSEPVLAELTALKQRAKKKTGFVFTTTGVSPVSGFSKVKSRLDERLGEGFEPWVFHDIRTAFATAMADIGEPENVVDRILNHVATGSAPSAVARVYNRAEMLPQRARVLDRWASYVTHEQTKVVRIG